jgi:hypothetical protein
VFDQRTNNDPNLDVLVDLKPHLRVGWNYVSVIGADWGGGYHYMYWLESTAGTVDQTPRDRFGPNNQTGICYVDSYVIEARA